MAIPDPHPVTRRIAATFYAALAVGVVLWWVLLVTWPSSRSLFFPDSLTGTALMSFWLADAVFLVGGSSATCWALLRRHCWAGIASWFVAGGCGYSALYCLVLSATTGQGVLGAMAMICAAGLCLAFGTVVGLDGTPKPFRVAESSPGWLFTKSLLQIIVFWNVFLTILPWGVLCLQAALGIPRWDWPWLVWVGGVWFALAGPLGLFSAWKMVMLGRGTPLPTDCAPVLVIDGPYRYVRNPMALAGIMQGVAVGVMLGSWPVMLYAASGGLVWHFGARPIEERDLSDRFGEAYEHYRRTMWCWVPRRRYRSLAEANAGE